ncbi:hydrogenase maturation protein HypF [Berryella intestinalis]|uniref:Carbamoyltransferase n=1 Tax=Berryella intestinalis TaxID=1531429 RepID=A0A0A8B5J3_9ACTN|nr:carbamoyltransferase HypF [Berryella intestinalis]AJC12594.1 hydrogenase maturation protein HypF [Berryella intestinalis]
MIEALDIQVKGVVQGVGFRPFVYRLAKRYLINGWVLNAVDGVTIHAEGEREHLDGFVMEIADNAPAAAKVERIKMRDAVLEGFTEFEIRFSDDGAAEATTLVSPDLATCEDCRRELFDPDNRRYRYPFINCTNCGPRFTIINGLPYDRPKTSMADFPMCPRCAKEYADPLDRRFHAQPDACFECGPHISWCEVVDGTAGEVTWGATRESSDRIFSEAVRVLSADGIVAVKGLGGFHLVCDASSEEALAKLRARKKRDGKAFAVMVATVEDARASCEVDGSEAALLESPARPIVLLRKRADARLAAGLADGLPDLGVMMPATPVQHLLIHDFAEATGKRMLVMTSGNVHDDPIVTDDGAARVALSRIADAILGNDRAIESRYDDSVVRVLSVPGTDAAGEPNRAVQFFRRARGFAPAPLRLEFPGDAASAPAAEGEGAPAPAGERGEAETGFGSDARGGGAPCILACGSEQKSTLALTRIPEVFVSQHIGDVENVETYDAWFEAKLRYESLFELSPTVAACDAHPEYLTAKWAREQDIPVIEVQHHHAHIASVIGEHGIDGAVCGIAFDGTGYGADGALWGGEVLLANRSDYERFANFSYVPMPGGAAAIENPLRMAYGVLWAFDLLDHPAARRVLDELGDQAAVCDQMIERGLNAPSTSSVGRLFDAAAALAGVCAHPTYEGEAAILFDAARCGESRVEDDERYRIAITKNAALPDSTAHDTSAVLLDASPTFSALLDDLEAGVSVQTVSLRFHAAFVRAMVDVAELVRGVYGISTVALSGGVFMNRYLVERGLEELGAAGFTVAINAELPPNDGCISFGQAVVASAVC